MSGSDPPAPHEAAERLSRAVVEGLEEGVVVTDAELRPTSWNASALRILGLTAEQLGADGFVSAAGALRYGDGRPLTAGDNPPARALRQGGPVRATLRRVAPDGVERWITVLARPIGGAHGTTRQGVVCTFEDVTARREAEEQVTFLAQHDRLTGLPNRTLLEQQLTRDLTRARRLGAAVALLAFDLDNFKLVNDSLGHAAGDAVLRETAMRVSELTRTGDVLARQGGDEFLLLLDCSGGDGDPHVVAQAAGERIAAAFERPFAVEGTEFHIGVSIGVALSPLHGEDAESLFRGAGAAVGQAKRAGGGTIAVYEPEARNLRHRLSLTTRLRHAIEADELRLHFQPIVRVEDGAIEAVEALVRWESRIDGLVPPGIFIPVAEEAGLIDGIGAWVVEALCRQAVAWGAEGFRPRLCFNVSPRQLRRDNLVGSIAGCIAAHGLDPGQFCAELTETALLSDARRHRSLLVELREAGLTVAIDDFGSGHSSLGRLRELPVQVLKVDRSFLACVPDDAGASAIVVAVLELGKALGMTTVVEGVEDLAQLDFLRRHGCPLAQGFLLGRPVPADQLERRLVGSGPNAAR
ncbi:MAG TPA: EAL domain-containing protein [Conexibacter sp.]|nr:EAL domain-containing protein [Conexibacter sp.]